MIKLVTIRNVAVMTCLLGLGACSDLNSTEQRVLSGGAIGAVAGTVGTVIMGGCIPCGTAIGGAIGAGSGYLIDEIRK